jgi:hypothetical protein
VSARLRSLAAGAMLLSLCTGSVQSKEAGPLWQGKRLGRCDVRLEQLHGAVDVVRASGRPRLLADPDHWQVKQERDADGKVTLTLERRAAPEVAAATPVLRVAPRCAVNVLTTDGAIDLSGPQRGPLVAESRTGAITLWVEQGASLNVNASTSADLTVDFGVDLEYLHHAEPSKRGAITVGDGTTGVELRSKRGAVRVLRADRRDRPGGPIAR